MSKSTTKSTPKSKTSSSTPGSVDKSKFFAGNSFQNSPDPNLLPIPSFTKKASPCISKISNSDTIYTLATSDPIEIQFNQSNRHQSEQHAGLANSEPTRHPIHTYLNSTNHRQPFIHNHYNPTTQYNPIVNSTNQYNPVSSGPNSLSPYYPNVNSMNPMYQPGGTNSSQYGQPIPHPTSNTSPEELEIMNASLRSMLKLNKSSNT